MTDPIRIEAPEGGAAALLLQPKEAPSPHILMLHGWSGDETVMWVLQSVLPANAFIVALRGIYPLPTGGYQWSNVPPSSRSGFEDYKVAVDALRRTLAALKASYGFGTRPLLLMGFSQGAALAFAARQSGIEVEGIIALAGFVPRGPLSNFGTIPVFWGHGIYDDLVPVQRAREDVRRLLDAQAEVHFCEADVGHKLGIECTRGLKRWIQGRILQESIEE